MTEDLDLFFTVEQMRDVFDFFQTNYQELCKTTSMILDDAGNDIDLLNVIQNSHMFNYLTEEPRPRDILYYICSMNDSLTEEERIAFFNRRDKFHKLFN
jgi:Na+-transporting NADH:ubiquinone oxidoreductase subunit NqrF